MKGLLSLGLRNLSVQLDVCTIRIVNINPLKMLYSRPIFAPGKMQIS